jgi:hypothetical protein
MNGLVIAKVYLAVIHSPGCNFGFQGLNLKGRNLRKQKPFIILIMGLLAIRIDGMTVRSLKKRDAVELSGRKKYQNGSMILITKLFFGSERLPGNIAKTNKYLS